MAVGQSDFKQLYDNFKVDKTVSFELIPAVRRPEGGCVDEANCDWEKATVCAFDQASGTADKVGFLVCMDETKGRETAMKAAEPCAKAQGLDFSAVTTCFNGSQGEDLCAAPRPSPCPSSRPPHRARSARTPPLAATATFCSAVRHTHTHARTHPRTHAH